MHLRWYATPRARIPKIKIDHDVGSGTGTVLDCGDAPPARGDEPPEGGDGPPDGDDEPPDGGDEPPDGGDDPPDGGDEPPDDPGRPAIVLPGKSMNGWETSPPRVKSSGRIGSTA